MDEGEFSEMLGAMGDFGMEDYWGEPDFILAEIVRTMVNLLGLKINITLFIHGMVVKGTLVSEVAYLASLTTTFRERLQARMSQLSAKTAEAVIEALDFRDLAESSVVLGDRVDADDEQIMGYPTAIRYLHLQNAAVISKSGGETDVSPPGSLLRVRLTQVDGWLLGEAVDEPPEDQI